MMDDTAAYDQLNIDPALAVKRPSPTKVTSVCRMSVELAGAKKKREEKEHTDVHSINIQLSFQVFPKAMPTMLQ